MVLQVTDPRGDVDRKFGVQADDSKVNCTLWRDGGCRVEEKALVFDVRWPRQKR